MKGVAAVLAALAVGLGLLSTASGDAAAPEEASATAPGRPLGTETAVEGHTTYAVLEPAEEDYATE